MVSWWKQPPLLSFWLCSYTVLEEVLATCNRLVLGEMISKGATGNESIGDTLSSKSLAPRSTGQVDINLLERLGDFSLWQTG